VVTYGDFGVRTDASITGTCVLQCKHVPQRPAEYDGWVEFADLPADVRTRLSAGPLPTRTGARTRMLASLPMLSRRGWQMSLRNLLTKLERCDGFARLEPSLKPYVHRSTMYNRARARFASHDAAKDAVEKWEGQVCGYAYTSYNDRPYRQRGWVATQQLKPRIRCPASR
jgi:hypothetical protein